MQVIEPRKPVNDKWNELPNPRPYVSVQGFAYDISGKFLVLHRSKAVRSAKDVWALPSGLHECGFTLLEQFAIELKEEFNLNAIVSTGQLIGAYENIAIEDGFHWCLHIAIIQVETLETLKNNEVEKHDDYTFFKPVDLIDRSSRLWKLKWAPTLREYLEKEAENIAHMIQANLTR